MQQLLQVRIAFYCFVSAARTQNGAPTTTRPQNQRPPPPPLPLKSLRALACCVRVTPWITALSVVLIFAGLPFW